jgi:hypothetical protein
VLLPQLVTCPYCGKPAEIDVDPDGGKRQDYEEECPNCAKLWKVHARIHGSSASVHLSAVEGDGEDEEEA